MKSKLLTISLLAVLLLGVVAPSFGPRAAAAASLVPVASAPHTPPAIFDKTRFLLHMGFAFYAFHHFVYARYKSGAFKAGVPHRARYIAEAALALLFTYHELKVSLGIANSSHSALPHKIVAPLNALVGKANRVAGKLNSGQFNGSDIQSFNSDVDNVGRQAKSIDYTIVDRTVAIPGL